MEAIRADLVTTAPVMLCRYCQNAHGFITASLRLESSTLPSVAIEYPTGYCIHASVHMMKKPESHEPRKTRSAENQCPHRPRRDWPKRNSPRKLDSRKNE